MERFSNLQTGGKLLAEKLRDQDLSDALVLAIACAGLPVAREIATQFRLPLDVVLIRRLLAPKGPESVAGAVNVAGTTVLDEQINVSANPSAPMEYFIVDAMNQFRERERTCRAGREPIPVVDRKILLVDCAIHTGATMKIALRALRKLRPARIIAAVPVASRDGSALIAGDADEFVCLAQPEPFGHSGMWFTNFDRPQNEDVPKFLDVA